MAPNKVRASNATRRGGLYLGGSNTANIGARNSDTRTFREIYVLLLFTNTGGMSALVDAICLKGIEIMHVSTAWTS